MRLKQVLAVVVLYLIPAVIVAGSVASNRAAAKDKADTGRLPVQQKALERRGDVVVDAKDALIRKTVQAYGGNYIRQGTATLLILNGKVYKTATIRVVGSHQVVIETQDGVYTLDVP